MRLASRERMHWLATALISLTVSPIMAQSVVSNVPGSTASTAPAVSLEVPTCATPPDGAPLEPPPTLPVAPEMVIILPGSGQSLTLPDEAASPEPSPSLVQSPVAEVCSPPPPLPRRPPPPNVFSSVALPVGTTSLSLRWMQVRALGLGEGEGVWDYILSRARPQDVSDQIWMINNWVNKRVDYVEDPGPDQWATAPETLLTGKGDCEDIAIAKMALLEALGVPEDDLFLLVVRDVYRKIDHAVLAVRRPAGMVILDSRTEKILPAEQVPDYRPTFAYSGPFAWTFGYRLGAARGALAPFGQPRR